MDLGQAKIADKSEDTKQATIILPQPDVLQPRVDHSRTRTWSVERLAWLPWNADQDALRDAVYERSPATCRPYRCQPREHPDGAR